MTQEPDNENSGPKVSTKRYPTLVTRSKEDGIEGSSGREPESREDAG